MNICVHVYICSNGVPLDHRILKVPRDIAKSMQIQDLTPNREFITYNQFKRKYDGNCNLFSYNIIISAIPKL